MSSKIYLRKPLNFVHTSIRIVKICSIHLSTFSKAVFVSSRSAEGLAERRDKWIKPNPNRGHRCQLGLCIDAPHRQEFRPHHRRFCNGMLLAQFLDAELLLAGFNSEQTAYPPPSPISLISFMPPTPLKADGRCTTTNEKNFSA